MILQWLQQAARGPQFVYKDPKTAMTPFQPPTNRPDNAPLFTTPPVPDHFKPPQVDGTGFDWGEGLPKDVVRRNMPPSSAPSFEERTSPIPPWHGGASNYPGARPLAPPGIPPAQAMRGPMPPQAPQQPQQIPVEQFGMTPKPSAPPGEGSTWHWAQNNPGNIRMSESSLKAYPGAMPGKNGFLAFATPEQGIAAIGQTFQHIARTRGVNTLRGIISVYAPKGDGANDPNAYAATVGKETGIDPDAPINVNDPAVMARIIPALVKVETGTSGPGRNVSPAGGVPPGSPPGVPPIRQPGAAPALAEQAPLRAPWGERNREWLEPLSDALVGLGSGIASTPAGSSPLTYLSQGTSAAAQNIGVADDKKLKRELLKAQIQKAKTGTGQSTDLIRNYQFQVLNGGFKGTLTEFAAKMEADKKGAGKTAELAAERDAALTYGRETLKASANTVLTNLDRAEKMAKTEWTATGLPAAATGWIPGTPAYEMRQRILLPIKSAIGLDRLTQMKTESGASLGQVAVFELQALQNSVAGLENAVTKDGFLQALADVKARYAEVMRKAGGTMPAPQSGDMGNGWTVRVR